MSIQPPAQEGPVTALGDPMSRTTPGPILGAAAPLGTLSQVQDAVSTRVTIAGSGPRKHLPVRLVDVDYTVKVPKAAFAMRLARAAKEAERTNDSSTMLELLELWVSKSFGAEHAADIWARLDDEDDELDITHLMQLMQAVMERATENPTT